MQRRKRKPKKDEKEFRAACAGTALGVLVNQNGEGCAEILNWERGAPYPPMISRTCTDKAAV